MWPSPQQLDEARLQGSGRGIRIAILDTGIDQSHHALASAIFAPPLAVQVGDGHDFSIASCEPKDLYGHGTAVAGIIHSLAPRAELLSVRVLDCRKRQHRHEAIKLGALQALSAGAHILNCSFGMPGVPFSLPLYKSWTDRAFEQDRHVVAAASNAAPEVAQWPAFFPQVLAVKPALLAPEQFHFTPASPVPFEACGVDVPVLAPGQGSAVMTGSSFAAAHLTGILARVLSEHPELSPSLAYEGLRQIAAYGG